MTITPRTTLFAVAAALAATTAHAAPTPAAVQAAKARHSNYEAMAKAFKRIGDQVKAGRIDPATARPAAQQLANLAAEQARHFPVGSGPQPGLKTHAKAEIWTDRATFDTRQKDNIAKAQVLANVAGTGDAAQVGAAWKALGGTCKACHDKFKEDDKH